MISQKLLRLRLKQLQAELARKKIEAYYLKNASNIQYFTNFTGSNGHLIVTPQKAHFITDFRYKGLAEKLLPPSIRLKIASKGLAPELEMILNKIAIQSLGFEAEELSFEAHKNLQKTLSKIKIRPVQDLCSPLRMVKDEEELRYLAKAQAITEEVFLEVKRKLRVGKTELELAWEIEKLGHEFGADTISFPPIVGFGPNSAIPHHHNTARKLKKGDIVLIDMGMKYRGYCSDMTRMIFTKQPTELQKKVYNTVLEAQEQSMEKLKAKVSGQEIDRCARSIIEKNGYGKTFGHSLGHGIGLEVHEAPNLSPHYRQSIPEGTVVTVEPGIYLENNFGVRIEDMVLVKSDRVINLTKIPKTLKESIRILA